MMISSGLKSDKTTMNWVYLSPHLDDVVLSCGGLLWEQAKSGMVVQILTVCAGDPPTMELSSFARQLHARWKTGLEAVAKRRFEDILSCKVLGVDHIHLDVPDCIYRHDRYGKALYNSNDALFGALDASEKFLVNRLIGEISDHLLPETQLVSPLAIGNHVDHQLVRMAAEKMDVKLRYYADYPYIMSNPNRVSDYVKSTWLMEQYPITDAGVKSWISAIAAHKSQISTFWSGMSEMSKSIYRYKKLKNGVCLWRAF
jgi:LmbE family N-acetylglucosaminyl deacetylase